MKLERKKSKQLEEVTAVPNMKSEENQAAGKEDGEPGASVTLMLGKPASRLHSLVIDCSTILFLDTSGVNALKEVRKDYGELGVGVVLSQCNTSVLDALERGGYYPEKNELDEGENKKIFFTIEDAVHYVQSLSAPNGSYDTRC